MLTPAGFRKHLEQLIELVDAGKDASEEIDLLISSHDAITNRSTELFPDDVETWDENSLFAGQEQLRENYDRLKATYRERFFSTTEETPEVVQGSPAAPETHISDIISDVRTGGR